MPKTKNALADLAECLSNDAEYLYGNNDKASEDVSKAQRIVSELAKVRCHAPFDEIPFDRDTNLAYRNCRAIAEEGAGDVK